jgi:hypothetical protein
MQCASLGSSRETTRATPSHILCTCRRRSWAHPHYEFATGTSTPDRCGTSRWDIELWGISSCVDEGQPANQPASLEKPTLGLVHVVPGALAAQNVLDFLLLQVLALVVALVDDEVVRAGEALEAVLAYVLLDCGVSWRYAADAQHVAAGWADCDGWLVRYSLRLWFEARDEWVEG